MVPARLRQAVPDRPRGGWRRFLPEATRKVFWTLVELFSRNNILTYASAIAFQVLIALVALVLLGLALIDILGLDVSVWVADVQPFVHRKFTYETFLAVERTVNDIFRSGSVGLLVFASLLALWEVSGAVRAISGALNEIYETEEERSVYRRFGTSFWLAAALIVCLVGALFAVTLTPRAPGVPNALGQMAGWIVAIALLSAAVWLLLRFAPSCRRSAGWTSVGSIMIVVGWVVATVVFAYWARNVANYRSVIGNLAAFLTLTSYLYTSSIIFLTGTQIDEMLRQQAERGYKGLEALVHLPGRDAGRGGQPRRRAGRRGVAPSPRRARASLSRHRRPPHRARARSAGRGSARAPT